ncbi:MAG: EF-hand domain-containing protein [Sulfurimonas sp.]|jgi:Ca2+-binding EF-hand superfamily protein|nr:EF-hand domain-containing protein [Sulfurimonas sp.]
MKTLLIVALIVTGALAVGQGRNMQSYTSLDSDGDGKVTQVEFENMQQSKMIKQAEAGKMMRNVANAPQFSDIDTNSDGNIDKDEFQTHQVKQQAKNRKNKSRGQGRNR